MEPRLPAVLPHGQSPDLVLVHPTSPECHEISRLTANEWKDALPFDQYLEESEYLLTAPLAKNGGVTQWCLVDKSLQPGNRPILASCESFRKRALFGDGNGGIKDVVVHGIASVFCSRTFRGQGYASRMMRELVSILKKWQCGNSQPCVATILYSDIGKNFYSKLGWAPLSSNLHMEFPARAVANLSGIVEVHSEDLKHLCMQDEDMIQKDLQGRSDGKRQLAIVPDHEHMGWHHAKEDFVCEKLFGTKPKVKGVVVGKPNERVWAIWTHRFYADPEADPAANALYILRLVLEDSNSERLRENLTLVIQAARNEAAHWNLGKVTLWDPSPIVRNLFVPVPIIERGQESIASVYWYGLSETQADEVPSWFTNEKYAWC